MEEWAREKAKQPSSSVDDKYWNRDIVELCRLSHQEPGTLSILMTGRKENLFHDVLSRVIDQPVFGDERLKFHAIFLKKPGYETTMMYKTSCLTDLLTHYDNCTELTIYDDRIRQLHGFQDFLTEFVEAMRPSLLFNLVHVAGVVKYLDPARERHIITRIFEEHNAAVTKYTSRVGKGDTPAQSFFVGKMDVREKRLGAAYVLTAFSRMEVVKFTLQTFSREIGESTIDKLRFQPRSILCTPHGTITSRKIATKIIMGLNGDPSEEEIDKCMELMNNGLDDSRIKFRLTRFGYSSRGLCVYDVEPVPSSTYAYTEFPALRLLAGVLANLTFEESEIYKDSIFEWIPIKQSVVIDADFGYDFIVSVVPNRKNRKRKPGFTNSRY